MIAFLFAGQGAQYPGMGAALCASSPAARDVALRVSEAAGLDIPSVFEHATAEQLQRTDIAQPAIFALSAAGLAAALERGIKPDCVAGFSLGECTALYAAGMLGLADTVRLITLRGALMQRASDERPGAMYAVIGLDTEKLEQICADTTGYVRPVNYNCPGQCVIAGEAEAAAQTAEAAVAAGAAKAVKLQVAGAFHSELMRSAAVDFERELAGYAFAPAAVPLYSDVTAEPLDAAPAGMPAYLARQMMSPVRFEQIVRNMLAAGVDTFIEFGPGRTLSGFVKRVSREARVFSVDKPEDLERLL